MCFLFPKGLENILDVVKINSKMTSVMNEHQ